MVNSTVTTYMSSPATTKKDFIDNVLPYMLLFPGNLSVVNVDPSERNSDHIYTVDTVTGESIIGGNSYYQMLDKRRISALCNHDVDINNIIEGFESYLSLLTSPSIAAMDNNEHTMLSPEIQHYYKWGPYGSDNVNFEKCLLLYNIGVSTMKLTSYIITKASDKSKLTTDDTKSIRLSLSKVSGIFAKMGEHMPPCGHWGPRNPTITRLDTSEMWKDLSITLAYAATYEQASKLSKNNGDLTEEKQHQFLAKIAQGLKNKWNQISFTVADQSANSDNIEGEEENSIDNDIDPIYISLLGAIYKSLPLYHWALYYNLNTKIDERYGKSVKCLDMARIHLKKALSKNGFKNITKTSDVEEQTGIINYGSTVQMFKDFMESIENNGNGLPTTSQRRQIILQRNKQVIESAIKFYIKINDLYVKHTKENTMVYHCRVPKTIAEFDQPTPLPADSYNNKIISYNIPIMSSEAIERSFSSFQQQQQQQQQQHQQQQQYQQQTRQEFSKNNYHVTHQVPDLLHRIRTVYSPIISCLKQYPHRNIDNNVVIGGKREENRELILNILNNHSKYEYVSTQTLLYATYQDELIAQLISSFMQYYSLLQDGKYGPQSIQQNLRSQFDHIESALKESEQFYAQFLSKLKLQMTQ